MPFIRNNYPTQTIFGAEMRNLTTAGGLNQMVAASSTWTRRNGVVWSSVEPTEGVYDWSAMAGLATELQNAYSAGMQVILIVRSTPEWARKMAGTGPDCGPISSSKMAAFGSFMHDLVARYSVPPYNVKYWELWNEEDAPYVSGNPVFGCWGDPTDAYGGGGYYAEMLKAAYPQIKAADPQAQVLVGGLLLDCDPRPNAGCAAVGHDPRQDKFLEGILLNGGGDYFDGVSFHAYDYTAAGLEGVYINPNWESAWNTTGPVEGAKIGYIQGLLDQYDVRGKFLINTEAALLCDSCKGTYNTISENTKASYVVQEFAVAIAGNLRASIWFSVLGWRNSNLLKANLTPLPAYTALQFARNELGNATWSRDITEYTGVKGFEFKRSNRRIWVVWSLDGATHSLNLPGAPLAAWSDLGSSISPAASMDIDLNPVYLEWKP